MKINIVFFASLLPLALAKAPLHNRVAKDAIDNSWIVMLKQGVDKAKVQSHYDLIRDTTKKLGLGLSQRGLVKTFDNIAGMNAYQIECNDKILEVIRQIPIVDYVINDARVSVQAVIPGLQGRQNQDTWGLGRISHRNRGLNNYVLSKMPQTYLRKAFLQAKAEQEFGGRASWGANFIDGSPNTDENGHGTHTAATAAGNTVGVDNSTTVIAVKCLDKNSGGTWSGVMAAINWAVGDAQSRKAINRSVINMSIGGDQYQPLDDMVEKAYQANMTVIVAASNYAQDACKYSPARGAHAIAIAAIDKNDVRASWSNWGQCVDIFAPGVDISSAWMSSDTGYATMSGTSMSAPHVAGIATYLMSRQGLTGPDSVKARILQLATPNMLTDPKGSPNLIAFNGAE